MIETMTREELQSNAETIAELGAEVTITGMWAWAKFEAKPSPETRSTLKEKGWKWSKNKGSWYLKGAMTFTRKSMGWEYITDKYGEEKV